MSAEHQERIEIISASRSSPKSTLVCNSYCNDDRLIDHIDV